MHGCHCTCAPPPPALLSPPPPPTVPLPRCAAGPDAARQPELRGSVSLVRELHVYGSAVAVHARDRCAVQAGRQAGSLRIWSGLLGPGAGAGDEASCSVGWRLDPLHASSVGAGAHRR